MGAMIAARRELAEEVRKRIRRRDLHTVDQQLLDKAQDEAANFPYIFEEEFHENPSPNMLDASLLEIQLWTMLRASRKRGDQSAERAKLLFVVGALIDLLLAEEEMLQSPLVTYYQNMIHAIEAYAKHGAP